MVVNIQARISHLVMDMLSFSKKRNPGVNDMDVVLMVNESMEMMDARADEEGVALVCQKAPATLPCHGDAAALQHALLNVIANGIDATKERTGGNVEVAVACDKGLGVVEVTVTDNGVGMSEEEREQAFSLFYSNKGHQGTGLGLAVSDKILREHGGTIQVESRPGEGSQFVLHWPIDAGESG